MRSRPRILRCRFGAFAGALRGDEVAVPVEAALRHALERRVVDVDEPEALPVAPRPFEVVEERPREVAAQGHALCDGARRAGEVAVEIRLALRIADAAVVPAHVRV